MAGMDIGFHPSSREVGYCLAILEFMDAGLGIVVSDEPSVSGATDHGNTGLLYQADNLGSACRAIALLAEDRQFRTKLGAQARKAVATGYTIEAATQQLVTNVVSRL